MESTNFTRNNLGLAASPYLRQHAGNPVWWQEWSPDVLRHAAGSGKLLFVSVGYATCHWCHVMAAEVFSDKDAADALNSAFVCIKVDRQERPDLDRYLMDFMTLNYGQGGWPLNVVLTPAAAPFAAATYIPLRSGYGRMGFVDYLERILAFYKEKGALIGAFDIPAPDDDGNVTGDKVIDARVSAWKRAMDAEWGGLGSGQKFPPHASLLFFLYAAAGADPASPGPAAADDIRALIEPSLDMMNSGGLHDHLQGGFYRYCTDREWTIPHFEKMLYDQALLLWVYALAARLFDRPDYAATARGVLRCLRDSFAHDGLFISGLDADTEHHEGATYLWSSGELRGLLGADEFSALEGVFQISEQGNFEGKNHLVMKNRRPGPGAASSLSENTRELLLSARRKRPQPEPDGLVVASWNALAGIALVQAWRLLGDRQALDDAIRLFELLLERHYSDGRLYRSSFGGRLNGTTYLEDAAAMLLFAGFLHEEDRSRGGIMAELKALVLSFRDGADADARWLESRNADFRSIPAGGFDSPLPSSSSLAEAALARADLVVSGTAAACSPGSPLQADFRSWAWLHTAGIVPVAGSPEVLPWSRLPPCTVQYQADVASLCRYGRCERL
jgi:uncharacterized protein YyaL (SSP411 family)